jgi:hypothetical protein
MSTVTPNEKTSPLGHRRSCSAALVVLCVLLAACDSTGSSDNSSGTDKGSSPTPSTLAAGSSYDPDINPEVFVAAVDNPFFTLEPGTVFKLRGETEDGVEEETITVTNRTKQVMGVTTTVVKDVMRVDGEVAEYTFDWYAQDRDGNVWYFGEDTAEYENGKVTSRSGSWEAGVDGALPGIIMNADPQVTDSFRQEYYEGEAEDMYWVVETGMTVKVPAGRYDDVVRTLEWTPLEPGIVVEKYHAPGVGLISEKALSGAKEVVQLLEVTGP